MRCVRTTVVPYATGRHSPGAVALKVLQIGSLGVEAVAPLPTHRDDVDAEFSRSRSQRRLDASQTALDAIQLYLGDAAFGRRMVATCLDLDGTVTAAAPRQDVDLTGRQREVARHNAIPRPSQRAACEVFSVLTGSLGCIASGVVAGWPTCRLPLPARHERSATPRCDRT